MTDPETDWLSWSCKIAAPGARDMSGADDAKLRQAVARAFKRVTGQACEVLISGWNGVRLNKPTKKRRAREVKEPQMDFFAEEKADAAEKRL